MARYGPIPRAERWVSVLNAPFDAPRSRRLPELLLGVPPCPEVVEWWNALRVMPHCVLWHDSDWQYALDTALLKQVFYTNPLRAGMATEIRRREDNMGTTVEARRKNGIRYVDADAPTVKPAPVVSSLDARRLRITEGASR